jgi:hypothetical protein
MLEHLLGRGEVLVARMSPRAQPGDALVDGRRRVRHGAQHRHAVGQVLLDLRSWHRGGDREDGLLGRDHRRHLAEQDVEVLRLDGDDDEAGARGSLAVRERRLDGVLVGQLLDALRAPAGDDDLVRRAPARAEEAGEERLADLASAEDCDAPAVDGHGGDSRRVRRNVARRRGAMLVPRQGRREPR